MKRMNPMPFSSLQLSIVLSSNFMFLCYKILSQDKINIGCEKQLLHYSNDAHTLYTHTKTLSLNENLRVEPTKLELLNCRH